MAKMKGKTSDAAEILRRRFVEGKPEMEALVRKERAKADVAQQLYDLRTKANLTQQQLANLVGTTASVICRLEDADYEGHSLSMLHRVAAALGSIVEVRFVPLKPAALGEAQEGIDERRVERKSGSKKPSPGRTRKPVRSKVIKTVAAEEGSVPAPPGGQ